MRKTISILGCGWFGFPLAKQLLAEGWYVKGSTTTERKLAVLEKVSVEPHLINIAMPGTFENAFFDSDYLLINIPPTKVFREVEYYLPVIEKIEQSNISKVIFISSTSVYAPDNAIVVESDTNNVKAGINQLLDIERVFQQAAFKTTIIRFGGLVGGERYPGRFFTSERIVKGAEQPINLIHLDDCIRLTEHVLNKDLFDDVFNGVASTHPTKREFYSLAAQLNGTETPIFSNDNSSIKIVSNQKVQDLGFEFKHDDLIGMLRKNNLWKRT